jgi:NDP-sugar pyrophosphorylase family protein
LKALILAGGFGTRLRPLSCTRPKSLFPVANKPLLQWTFERLAKSRIEEAILAVNYQTEAAIKQYRVPKYGIHTRYSRDPLRKPLGTGGPIRKAEKHIGHDSPFLVLNGDIFADVDYTEILKVHEQKEAIATITLHKVEDPSRYGVAQLDEDNRIVRFVEKPLRESAPSNLINAGVYVLSPRIFDYIPEGRAISIERDVFPRLAEEKKLYGYTFDGLWIDIGKPEDYLQINRILLGSVSSRPKCKIGKNAKINMPVAFDTKVSIGERSVVGPYAVLGRNVKVGNDVHIRDSVILPNTVISDSSLVDSAVIGDGAFIGKGAKIKKGCMLGDHVKIGDNVTLVEGVQVCPAKEIFESVLVSRAIC